MKCEINENSKSTQRSMRKKELLKEMQALEWKLKKGNITLETYRELKKQMSDEISMLIIEQSIENKERMKKEEE